MVCCVGLLKGHASLPIASGRPPSLKSKPRGMKGRKQTAPENDGASGTESEGSSSSEEEESKHGGGGKRMSDYEEERLTRIAANKARLAALGIPAIASSIAASSSRLTRRKAQAQAQRKPREDDEDYNPTDDDASRGADVSDDEEEDEDEDEFVPSKRRRNNVKSGGCKSKKRAVAPADAFLSGVDVGDEDEQLMQAIALSLQDSAKDVAGGEKKGDARVPEDAGKRKRMKSFESRVKMTEDELVLHFFQFDDGNGNVGVRDLKRVAVAHDFTWTDKELADMIQCFDSDGDGKLNLDDLRKIAGRCNMIQGGADC